MIGPDVPGLVMSKPDPKYQASDMLPNPCLRALKEE